MGRRRKRSCEIEGQLSFNFSLDTNNYVVQSNSLVRGKQTLKLNSAKLIRCAIMQIRPEDTDFKPYVVSIDELAGLLGISSSNLYRDIEGITDDIIKNPVYIRQEKNGKTIGFVKMPWVSKCEYRAGVGLAIKLNSELRPYLLGLCGAGDYTQYIFEETRGVKTPYAIRILELIFEGIKFRSVPRKGASVIIPLNEIKECCGCEGKYNDIRDFKKRVLEPAVSGINDEGIYCVEYSLIKEGRVVVSIEFTIKSICNVSDFIEG